MEYDQSELEFEKHRLEDTKALALKQLECARKRNEENKSDIIKAKKEMRDNTSHSIPDLWSSDGFEALAELSQDMNFVTDKIVAFPTTYAWKMANYGKVHAAGVDAILAATVPLTEKIRLIMSGGYTWQKAIDLTDSDAKNYKDQLPYTPLHSGNASAIVETPWVNVGYSAVGVGKRYYLSQNIPENEIEGYLEHTMSLSHEFALGGCRLLLQAEIINLTDEQYDVIKYYPMPGRSWRLTGTFKF